MGSVAIADVLLKNQEPTEQSWAGLEAAKIRSGSKTEFDFSEQFEGCLMRLAARVASCQGQRNPQSDSAVKRSVADP